MNSPQHVTASGQVPAHRPPLRVLRWPLVVGGGITVVLATAVVISWLWTEAGGDPQLRIEAIKAGFTVGFGVGGSLALVLAAQRQWLQERAQAHQEDLAVINQAHQERVAAANEHDASERRITDLYIRPLTSSVRPKLRSGSAGSTPSNASPKPTPLIDKPLAA